jgi:hypothetical protein
MIARLRLLAFTLALLGMAATEPGSYALASDAGPSNPPAQSIESGGINLPPDCSGAVATPATLWPRDHLYHLITIAGVSDPDGDPVSIVATVITQDEPGDEVSDGGACPDAILDAAGLVYLRAEGSPGGNGRVYRVKFVATDSHGASCTGTVEVCVPPAEGAPCTDDGQTVNALQPCLGGNMAPTIPVIDECRCTATVFVRGAGGELHTETRTTLVTEQAPFPPAVPRDTCPANSRIDVLWHAEPPIALGYRYRLDEPQWIEVGPQVTSVTYNSGVAPDTTPPLPGTKTFILRAVNQETSAPDPTRFFQLNLRPDTWVAGPDPDVTGAAWHTKPNGEKYALLVNGSLPSTGLPGTLLGPDSVAILPADRLSRRTFLEIYRDSVFLRHEFDTVHKAAWVVFHGGGFDADSRYRVRVADGVGQILPTFPGGVVLTPAPANGSPVGFRSRISTFLTPNGPTAQTAQSGLYPFYDPNSVFNFQRIGFYFPMALSGRAYAVQRAEDGDGARDNRIALGDERRIVEFPVGSYEQSLRPLVMVFEVDQPPELATTYPNFRPRVTAVDTFTSRTWDLHLPGIDPDPYEPGAPFGGPSQSQLLRMRFRVTGMDADGNPLTFLDPAPGEVQQKYVNAEDVDLTVPASLASGPATLTVELCDCSFCEDAPGSGRCITQDIPVYYQAPLSFAGFRKPTLAMGGELPMTTSLGVPLEGPGGGGVTIRFDLAAPGIADVDIYDVTGQRVRRLASAWFPAGRQTAGWDHRDQQGREVGPGIYFVRLRTAETTLTRKYFSAR